MTRKNCKQPDACVAGSRGPCRLCSDMTARAERMRKLRADPEFAAAHAERMRKLHADPEFAAANAERMRKMNADPEFAAAHAERMRKLHAEKLHACGVPVGAEDDYRLARKKGFSKKEAVRIAKQSRPTREAAE